MNRKLLILTAILVFAALIVTGCGSDDKGKTDDATEVVELKSVGTETEETEPAETETAGAETGADGIKISLLTEGNGMYVYTDHEGDQFSGEDGFFEAVSGATYEIEAVASEGWNFVNWKKDGSDYSTDAKISLSFSQDTELTAVFAEK